MRERPILFSAPMVRAILEGRKTQTRRVVKGAPTWESSYVLGVHQGVWGIHAHVDAIGAFRAKCPYGQPGDRLWVRETWGIHDQGFDTAEESTFPVYRADTDRPEPKRWRPSIHMPRWASRITLEVTGVRVERLKNISKPDAVAEGLVQLPASGRYVVNPGEQYFGGASHDPTTVFADLWERINGAGSWRANPWVWVVEFRRIKQGARAA